MFSDEEKLVTSIDRPLLRWAGSKRKLLAAIIRVAPSSFARYIEPFCGSVSLFLRLKPESAVLSDLNAELIHFYKRLSCHPIKVARLTHDMPVTDEFFYELRAADPTSLSVDERAARFLYLNRFCFNGVYRTNKAGQFNVPRGKHMGAIPSSEEIVAFGRFIRRAEFRCSDFEETLAEAKPQDFVYLDPPYAGRGVRDRGEYGPGSFKEADIERLVRVMEDLSERGVKVLLSYADVSVVRSSFKGWQISDVAVGRNVSGFMKGRSTVNELFVTNYRTELA